jgi:hypothetical protein
VLDPQRHIIDPKTSYLKCPKMEEFIAKERQTFYSNMQDFNSRFVGHCNSLFGSQCIRGHFTANTKYVKITCKFKKCLY